MLLKIFALGALCVPATLAAQIPAAVQTDGRWIVPPFASAVDPSMIDSEVYFPLSMLGPPVKDGVMTAAAVCRGKYTGFPSSKGFSVSGHAHAMTVITLSVTNAYGAVIRRENVDVLVLRNCKFKAIDMGTYGSAFPAKSGRSQHEEDLRDARSSNWPDD